MSGQVGYVGHRAKYLVTPTEGNQALPGVGDPATWAPKATRRPLFPVQPLDHHRGHDVVTVAQRVQLPPGERPPAGVARGGVPGLVHPRQGDDQQPRLLRRIRREGLQGVTSATEGAYWQNTYDPDAEWGPAFHDVRHNFVLSGTYELPFGRGRKWGSDWSGVKNAFLGGWKVGGIFQARTGLPITVIDGRARSLQGERGSERPNCVGDPVPSDQSIARWLDIGAFQAVPLGTFGNCPVGWRGRRATGTSTSSSRRASRWARTGISSSASRPST